MDNVQKWVPSEAEVPSDHWSKSPEYLAEKVAAVHPGQGFVAQSNIKTGDRSSTTHAQAMSHFSVPYVKTQAELDAELEAAEKAIRASFDEQALEKLATDILSNVDKALREKDASLPA